MVAYNSYQIAVEDQFEGVHDWDAHTFKIMLSNTAPNAATHATRSQATELSTANGYTSGGNTTTISTSRSGGTFKATGTDPTPWTGSGAGFTAQYAILYNDTPTSPADPLWCWWNYGSAVTVLAGETLTVDLDATNGIYTAAATS